MSMHYTQPADSRRRSIMKSIVRKKGIVDNIKAIRRAKRADIPKVEALVSGRTTSFFGRVNVTDLL